MTQTLYVPPHWCCSWWSGDGSLIRMSCPSCGHFDLMLTLDKPANTIRNLSCSTCGLTGLENVQASMNSWGERHAREMAADTAAHADAAAESNMSVAAKRNWQTQGKRKTAA